MKFEHVLAAGGLMKSVDILCNHSAKFSLFLQFSQTNVSPVRLDPFDYKLFPMKPVILIRITVKEGMTEDRLRRIVPLLVIKAVYTAKVRNPAFCGYTGTAKENDGPILSISGYFHS